MMPAGSNPAWKLDEHLARTVVFPFANGDVTLAVRHANENVTSRHDDAACARERCRR